MDASPSDRMKTPQRRAEKEVDDEQVERFYALLANIRALRGAFGTSATTMTTGKRKPGRREEPPWRPAFRMEDFDFQTEEVASESGAEAGRKKKKKNTGCGCPRTMPAGSDTGAVESGNDGKEGAGHALEPNSPGADAARVDQLPVLY
jgi:hypothetical protein